MNPDSITFVVYGPPASKLRPKAHVVKGVPIMYTDKKTLSYEETVRQMFIKAAERRKITLPIPHEGPVWLNVLCLFPIPDSWPRWKKDRAINANIPHLTKPDYDNLLKIISDGLNGIAFKDDKQITIAKIAKIYGDYPRTEITLTYAADPFAGGRKGEHEESMHELPELAAKEDA